MENAVVRKAQDQLKANHARIIEVLQSSVLRQTSLGEQLLNAENQIGTIASLQHDKSQADVTIARLQKENEMLHTAAAAANQERDRKACDELAEARRLLAERKAELLKAQLAERDRREELDALHAKAARLRSEHDLERARAEDGVKELASVSQRLRIFEEEAAQHAEHQEAEFRQLRESLKEMRRSLKEAEARGAVTERELNASLQQEREENARLRAECDQAQKDADSLVSVNAYLEEELAKLRAQLAQPRQSQFAKYVKVQNENQILKNKVESLESGSQRKAIRRRASANSSQRVVGAHPPHEGRRASAIGREKPVRQPTPPHAPSVKLREPRQF